MCLPHNLTSHTTTTLSPTLIQTHEICDNPAFMAALEAAWPCVKTDCGVLKVSHEQLVITMRDVSGISNLHGTPCSTQPIVSLCVAHGSACTLLN